MADPAHPNRKFAIIFFVILFVLISFNIRCKRWQDDSIYIGSGIVAKKLNLTHSNGNLDLKKPTLIFTCLGTQAFSNYQSYIWQALEQARLMNPNISLVIILNKDAYVDSVVHKLNSTGATIAFIDELVKSNALLQEFRRTYFERGIMKPNGNQNFVQYAVERLIAVYAYMNQTGLSNVFHMENDNMMYADLHQLTVRMYECNVSLAMPRVSVDQVVTSFVFIRNSQSIERFAEWSVSIFRMGPEKAIQLLGTSWINDMSLGSRYLQMFAASSEQSTKTGIFELPTRLYSRNESCCICRASNQTSIIFDASVLGQYFGGNFENPDASFWAPKRLMDPRGLALEWHSSEFDDLKRPYIKGTQIMNIHVHSKRLERFSSFGNKQTKGF